MPVRLFASIPALLYLRPFLIRVGIAWVLLLIVALSLIGT